MGEFGCHQGSWLDAVGTSGLRMVSSSRLAGPRLHLSADGDGGAPGLSSRGGAGFEAGNGTLAARSRPARGAAGSAVSLAPHLPHEAPAAAGEVCIMPSERHIRWWPNERFNSSLAHLKVPLTRADAFLRLEVLHLSASKLKMANRSDKGKRAVVHCGSQDRAPLSLRPELQRTCFDKGLCVGDGRI
mgnify:CR=1 FL=1